MTRIEMKVDDVKTSEKGLDSCILKSAKDETMINGTVVEVTVTIKADGRDIFEELGMNHKGDPIDVVLKESAQQTLV